MRVIFSLNIRVLPMDLGRQRGFLLDGEDPPIIIIIIIIIIMSAYKFHLYHINSASCIIFIMKIDNIN